MATILDGSNLWKYLAAWLVMLVISIGNGAGRDFIYGKHLSELASHQVSTASGILLIGIVIWVFGKLVAPASGREALSIGLFWAALTVAFEFIFFHYVGGHSWAELLANYNVLKGRVWVFLVLWIAVAPYVFFRFRDPG
jgi:hypothetical protein